MRKVNQIWLFALKIKSHYEEREGGLFPASLEGDALA